jgi:hypothetical protein
MNNLKSNEKRKFKNYLKIGLLLFGTSLLLWNCQKSELVEFSDANNNFIPAQTVSFNDAQSYFNSALKKSTSNKGIDNFQVTPLWESMNQVPLNFTDALLTNVDVSINKPGNYASELFFINVEGKMKNVIYTIYKDSISDNGNIINARIYFNDLNGSFIDGYRIENGLFTTRFVPDFSKNKSNFKSNKSLNVPIVWNDSPIVLNGGILKEVDLGTIHNSTYNPSSWFIDINRGYTFSSYADYANYGNSSFNGGHGYTGAAGNILINQPVEIINKLTNPCAKNIFTELENGIFTTDPLKPEIQIPNESINLNFSESILKLFNESNTSLLLIRNGDNVKGNAHTIGTSITLKNSYLESATQLSIARSIIHELVHTYLNGIYLGLPDFENKSLNEKMKIFAKDNGYIIGTNRFQHEFMGQFIEAMAYSLYEWDKNYGTGGNLGWDYYYAMGFGGFFYEKKDSNGNNMLDINGDPILEETDSFKELVPNKIDRNKIIKILYDEQEGNTFSKGTKCE